MMTFIIIACSLLLLLYAARIGTIAYMFKTDHSPLPSSLPEVSILIAARNEEENIVACLSSIEQQDIDMGKVEVIVIDDFSDDATVEKAMNFKARFNLKVIKNKQAGKKHALKTGIETASNNIILITDADCNTGKDWVATMLDHFQTHDLHMLCGLVRFRASGLFQHLQQAESAAIVGIGAVMLNEEKPCTCNGANLMFRKDVFEKLGGYASHAGLLSGDDDLLMQSFAMYDLYKTRYLINKQSIVTTDPCEDLRTFLHQRSRWLSKRKAYQFKYNELLQVLVVMHLPAFYVLSFILFFEATYASDAAIALGLKYAADFYYGLKLKKVIDFKPLLILLMPFYQVYIFIVLLYGRFVKVEWKNRVVE